MRWTIAICTVRQRKGLLRRLLNRLEPQLGGYDIEVIIADQDWPLSKKRQWCLDSARGDFFSFIDDDDLVSEDYVERIYPYLTGEFDYIGFRVQYYHDGEPWKPTFHSLRYGTHAIYADESGFYRGVSHLNPIKLEIARQGKYEGGFGEDNRWSAQVNPVTEHYIDEVMYHYLFSPSTSLTYGRD